MSDSSAPAPEVTLVKHAPAPEEAAVAPQAPPAEQQDSAQAEEPSSTSETRREAEEPANAPPAEATQDASHEAGMRVSEPNSEPAKAQEQTAVAVTEAPALERVQPEPERAPEARQEAEEPVLPQSGPEADSRHDFIEQIFQKVEQESERRANEEEARSRPSTANATANSSGNSPPASQTTVAVARDQTRERDRRRGSISVSRFGQATDLATGTHDNPSTLPSRKNSLIINAGSTGAFYQAQKYAGSADSFASDTEDAAHHEEREEEQVTQMETIAGRVSLGKAMGRTIARRLSRARTRSRDILAVPNGLVIGVSVEEATVEAEHQDEKEGDGEVPRTPHGTVFAFAQAQGPGTRSRRSTVSMPNPPQAAATPAPPTGTLTPALDKRSSAANWVAKAKDLTKMFKRRSMAVLPQNSSP